MIEHCPKNFFKSPIVNWSWSLILGFILWNVWKERNKAIFQDQPSSSASTWGLVKENKRETIMSERCDLDDWKANLHETTILLSLKLAQNMSIPQMPSRKDPLVSSPSIFQLLPQWFVQINFDRASKENPSPTRYRGILRSSSDSPFGIYDALCGSMLNNVEELMTVEKGLSLAWNLDCHKIHIIGDSKIFI